MAFWVILNPKVEIIPFVTAFMEDRSVMRKTF